MIDLLQLSKKLPPALRLKALSRALDVAVPFNLGLGIDIVKLTEQEVCLKGPDKRKRRNHVQSAHACYLALLGEYPAGLLLAQKFSFADYRIIIAELNIQYFKQGRGTLTGRVKPPKKWPKLKNGELFIALTSEITNEKKELVARCETRWQIKEWQRVKSRLKSKS